MSAHTLLVGYTSQLFIQCETVNKPMMSFPVAVKLCCHATALIQLYIDIQMTKIFLKTLSGQQINIPIPNVFFCSTWFLCSAAHFVCGGFQEISRFLLLKECVFVGCHLWDMHKCLGEFKFRPDLTTDYGVNCPSASEKFMCNVVATLLEPSFLIGSSSFLQVTSTCIYAWMILNFGHIPPLITELAALECLKN